MFSFFKGFPDYLSRSKDTKQPTCVLLSPANLYLNVKTQITITVLYFGEESNTCSNDNKFVLQKVLFSVKDEADYGQVTLDGASYISPCFLYWIHVPLIAQPSCSSKESMDHCHLILRHPNQTISVGCTFPLHYKRMLLLGL